MSTDRITELEAIAKAATQGDWFPVHGVILVDAPGRGETEFPAIAAVSLHNEDANAAHIAAFDPPAVLKLLAVAMEATKHMKAADACDGPACFSSWDALRAALAAIRAGHESTT